MPQGIKIPRHANKGSFKPNENHRYWKGGTSDYWGKKARELTNCPKGFVVHHRNGNYKDNRIENLQVITQSEHVAIHNKQRRGTIKPNSKIRQVIKKVLELNKQGYLRKEIAEILNIQFRMVKRCLTSEWRCQYEQE